MTGYVTEGAASYADAMTGDAEAVRRVMGYKGASLLRKVGVKTPGYDLALLAYLCLKGMQDLVRDGGSIEDDYLVANDVLDEYVTDHDAELLAEMTPEVKARVYSEGVGSMTPEVTAVHDILLLVVGHIRERWTKED